MNLIGPFTQILTMNGLPLKGKIADGALEIITDGGVLINEGMIHSIGKFSDLKKQNPDAALDRQEEDQVLLPGFLDCHTHICFAGSRAQDYAMRLSGKSYLDIARSGGGIWDTVTQTRKASEDRLMQLTIERAQRHLKAGITTTEVKSGYGLKVPEEIKILKAIQKANSEIEADLIPTCLAAHLKPLDFKGNEAAYLSLMEKELFPILKKKRLAGRMDIFIEDTAFDPAAALVYLKKAKAAGFDLTAHADQFTSGGSKMAVACGAVSADHLEASTNTDIERLAHSETAATVLPGASLGLGIPFAPARKLLEVGCCLAIASDWNPGSAPMGDLLTQAALLGAYEKLSVAECLAGLTTRAAHALRLTDRGALKPNLLADMQGYTTKDYRDIFYYQGALKPARVWKKGKQYE